MKLPKEIQKKESTKPRRPQAVKKPTGGQQFGSRQMRRRMQNQGIDMDQVDAKRVIIEGAERTLVIDDPEVVLMKQAGQEIYQVIGSAEEYLPDEFNISEMAVGENLDSPEISGQKTKITESDIMLVATQGNVSPEEAKAVLLECDGDIAKSILNLKNRP